MPAPDSPPAYRVLARKYRPAGFDALIGQDAMVRTLANAIARDRLAHAWLLTGVRGVGKTSTARIIAKALNCTGADGGGGPTIEPCGRCDACVAIGEGRHIDVVEMDAASNTGIDDVREIIDSVRYATVSARFKIYIIDEVHMLSKNAFNGLLKTLEEPPPHVKFIFATTEVNRLPVTVLSRCQRFDLKRIPQQALAAHFARVADLEAVAVEPEALALIVRAAEGSVRDGLSILDQAIAHAGAEGGVTATQVRDMLGLADRGGTRALMDLLLTADAPGMLRHVADGYERGVEPQAVLGDLLDMVHALTRTRVAGHADERLPDEDRAALARWAGGVGFAALHRLWQLLLKGLADVNAAPAPMQALEMALLRVVHAAGLPDPADLLRRLEGGEVVAVARAVTPVDDAPAYANVGAGEAPSVALRAPPPPAGEDHFSSPAGGGGIDPPSSPAGGGGIDRSVDDGGGLAECAPMPADFPALVRLVENAREPLLAKLLHDDVGCLDLRPPRLLLARGGPLPSSFAADLQKLLTRETGAEWRVAFGDGAAPSLKALDDAARDALLAAARADPRYLALKEHFPDADIIEASSRSAA